jgi:dihydroflavonol-4-reductase
MALPSDKGMCLVTGVSGFVGLHVAKAAVEAGYTVRGTVRSIERHKEALTSVVPSLELIEVTLDSSDEEWLKAAEGCSVCCHVASPFPIATPKDENELIKPVRTLLAPLSLGGSG